MRDLYLDYNASAPLDPRVLDAMLPALRGVGNASSVHPYGQRQAAAVQLAREEIALLVGCGPGDVIFTAGATEANNHVLQGIVECAPAGRNRVLISAVEHASVREVARWLGAQGLAKVEHIPVTSGGFVDLSALGALLAEDVLLVSVMAANSETGVLNPVREAADRARAVGALVHCDATQALGRIEFQINEANVDFLSLSGHKIYGPGGIGALIATRDGRRALRPILHGGGQEQGLRSGSLNVAGAVGLGEAARLAAEERSSDAEHMARLRDRLVSAVTSRLPEVEENGNSHRLPNTANLRFSGADAEAVLANMDPVAASAGSACSSGTIEPSPVLLAMGKSRQAASESIRFSVGRFSTEGEIDLAADLTVTAVQYVRDMTQEER